MRLARGVTIDAVCLSPHKFIGGPGASGVMILRRAACACDRPSWPGGGTVTYVSSSTAQYSDRIEDREEAGTPNILGDIRAGLAFMVKAAIGQAYLTERQTALAARGLDALGGQDGITVVGDPAIPRLPIFSVLFHDTDGAPIHYNYATRLLSDLHGVQSRGGCACAGPYGHRLLGYSKEDEAKIYGSIALGQELERPGFVRFNLSALMTEAEIAQILDAACTLPEAAKRYAARYKSDPATGQFVPVQAQFASVGGNAGQSGRGSILSRIAASLF
jgi:selenocysteine lyase/cysteine desulfurase